MKRFLSVDVNICNSQRISVSFHLIIFLEIHINQTFGISHPYIALLVLYGRAQCENRTGNTVYEIVRNKSFFLVVAVESVIGSYPEPFFVIFQYEHTIFSFQLCIRLQPSETAHGEIGYTHTAFVRQEIKIMVGVFIYNSDLFFMNKVFREDVGFQTFGRGVPDTHAIFRTNPSFMGGVEIDFVNIPFR